jgi:hypothetical protein
VVRGAARDPRKGQQAVDAWKNADATAKPLFDYDRMLRGITRPTRSNENVMGALINASSAKSGNAKLLADLRRSMPQQDFENISGVLLSELGTRRATRQFSLNQFTTKWGDMSPQAKAALFSPQHRAALDDIAHLGSFLKDADKYLNASHSGGAVALLGSEVTSVEQALKMGYGPGDPIILNGKLQQIKRNAPSTTVVPQRNQQQQM